MTHDEPEQERQQPFQTEIHFVQKGVFIQDGTPKRIDDVLHKEHIDNEEDQYSTDNEHRLLRGGYFRGREG
jgi:hypothetical protein